MVTCTFENGSRNKLRHVVVDVLVIKDDKILLVKRAEKLLEGGKWALVGGYMETDERVVRGVKREIMEETGYEVSNLEFVWVKDDPQRKGEKRQNIAFVFIAQAGEKKGESDWEVTDQKWYSFDNLPPKEEIAFDHYADIEKYLRFKKGEKISMLEVTE